MEQTENDYELNGIFPVPIYRAYRDSDLDTTEESEIEDIFKEGMFNQDWIDENEFYYPEGKESSLRFNSTSADQYIFNTKLKKIKQFCEKHIKIYVKEVLNPKHEGDGDLYITGSWLTKTRPGEYHHPHNHNNSIISGVFYIETLEDDRIYFHRLKEVNEWFEFEAEEYNPWNSSSWFVPIEKNNLLLFPSWLEHSVEENKSTKNRISLSFNTFARSHGSPKLMHHRRLQEAQHQQNEK